jgi:hypothetical protein
MVGGRVDAGRSEPRPYNGGEFGGGRIERGRVDAGRSEPRPYNGGEFGGGRIERDRVEAGRSEPRGEGELGVEAVGGVTRERDRV